MRITNQRNMISDNVISLILISSFCMIALAFFMDISIITIFLFLNILLSIFAFFLRITVEREYVKYGVLLIGIILLHFIIYYGTIKFVDTLILISVVCFVTVIASNQLTKANQDILFWGSLVCSCLMIYNMNNTEFYNSNGWLELVYQNSNTAGVVGLNLFVCILLTMEQRKRKVIKVFAILFLIGLSRVIFLTSSRSSFTAMILSLIFFIWNKRKKIKIVFLKLFIIIPILIIPIMILYYDIIPTDFLYLGKTIQSGREVLWKEAVEIILSNLLNIQNEFTSGLNIALRLPYLCGIFGTIIFFLFLYKLLMNVNTRMTYKTNANIALIIFGCLLFQQSFESTIISGTYSICFLSYATIGLSVNEEKEK